MTLFEHGPHALVTEGLNQAFTTQNLDDLHRWLELVPTPRPARQQVVREVLNPDRSDPAAENFVQRALDVRWTAALPLLVQAGARLDWGPADEPKDDEAPGARRWFSAVNGLLGVISHDAAQWRSSPPDGRARVRKPSLVPNPDQDPLVVMLRTLCEAGARVNVRDDLGRSPLLMVINGTGWWASVRSDLKARNGVTWLPQERPEVPGAVDDASHLDGPSATVGEALFRVLLRAGANPNLSDHSGHAPLHDMVLLTHTFRPFVWALNAGADPHRLNGTGQTPFGVAQERAQPLLLAAMAEVEKRALRATLKTDGEATLPGMMDAGARRRL